MVNLLGKLIHKGFDFLHERTCGCTFTDATEEKMAELEANRLACTEGCADDA